MDTLAKLLDRLLLNDDTSAIPLIIDLLQETNDYRYNKFRNTYGRFVAYCNSKWKEIEKNRNYKTQTTTIKNENNNPETISLSDIEMHQENAFNRLVRRHWEKFKYDLEEIFWETLVPSANSLISEIVNRALEVKPDSWDHSKAQKSGGSGARRDANYEQLYE